MIIGIKCKYYLIWHFFAKRPITWPVYQPQGFIYLKWQKYLIKIDIEGKKRHLCTLSVFIWIIEAWWNLWYSCNYQICRLAQSHAPYTVRTENMSSDPCWWNGALCLNVRAWHTSFCCINGSQSHWGSVLTSYSTLRLHGEPSMSLILTLKAI